MKQLFNTTTFVSAAMIFLCTGLCLGTVNCAPRWQPPIPMAWTQQFGTGSDDVVMAATIDTTGVYIAGNTEGTFPGQSSTGYFDAFVRKYDTDGNELWTRQFGTEYYDFIMSIIADATGVYIAGETEGTFPGQSSTGYSDAFVRKYDADGNELWTRQFGTEHLDEAYAVAADATGVYIAGETEGTLPGQSSTGYSDAFVRKYDADGNELWTRQFGTEYTDFIASVAADATGVYMAGGTYGTFPGQRSTVYSDVFVRKYDADGNELWTWQFGTEHFDEAHAVTTDATGVYVAGSTYGIFPGQRSAGGWDAFIIKLFK
jgi:hypothetical protein